MRAKPKCNREYRTGNFDRKEVGEDLDLTDSAIFQVKTGISS